MPDPTPSLVDIAAAIRRNSPGAVPESIAFDGHRFGIGGVDHTGTIPTLAEIPDDIASHVLGFAMVIALPFLVRDERNGAMCWGIDDPKDGVRTWFADSDHNNDPLLSLFSAWKFAKGINNA